MTRGRISPFGKSRKPNPLSILLRATRMCFYYSEDLHTYVRMRWLDKSEGHERIKVEICPPEKIHDHTKYSRVGKRDKVEYISWNDNAEEGKRIISLLQLPKNNGRTYKFFEVNGKGELI